LVRTSLAAGTKKRKKRHSWLEMGLQRAEKAGTSHLWRGGEALGGNTPLLYIKRGGEGRGMPGL